MGYEKPWWYRLYNLIWAAIAILRAQRLWSGDALRRARAVILLLDAVASAVRAVRPATHRSAQPPPGQ
jgi:hypothetical protein